MKHAEEHEGLLQKLVLGETSEDAAEIRDLLGGCSTCSARWARLARIRAALDRDEEERAEVLAQARRTSAPAVEERALAALEAHWRRESLPLPAHGVRRRRWSAWLLAAAALVVALFVWSPWSRDADHGLPHRTWLGGESTAGFSAAESLAGSSTFAWPSGWIGARGGTLRIQELHGEAWRDAFTIAIAPHATSGSAPPELLAPFAERLRWRLESDDGSGERRVSDWLSFSH